eukprot:23523-Eustigmatos_ZCMA.PRE.1
MHSSQRLYTMSNHVPRLHWRTCACATGLGQGGSDDGLHLCLPCSTHLLSRHTGGINWQLLQTGLIKSI